MSSVNDVVAVYLKSESGDNYLYLYSKRVPIIANLKRDCYEFEIKCICDVEVESGDELYKQAAKDLICSYLFDGEDE